MSCRMANNSQCIPPPVHFDVCQLDEDQRRKLLKLLSEIVSVNVPFSNPFKTFCRGTKNYAVSKKTFICLSRELYQDIAKVALKYFYDHAMHWLTPINVALNVFAK